MTKHEIKNKVNQDLNTVRAVKTVIKKAKPSKLKLGEETIPHVPHDIEIMFLGKVMESNNEQQVRISNIIAGLKKSYSVIPIHVEEMLENYLSVFKADFEKQKKLTIKIVDLHALSLKLCKIRGFTSYQLGIIMSHIKSPLKFPSPSNLFVYAGVAPKNGKVVTKTTLAEHRMAKHEEYTLKGLSEPEDFVEFGFNMELKKRMYIISESLIKQKGFFYSEFLKARLHLEQRAINNNECFLATEQDTKDSKGIMQVGKYYMHNKKNQSLIMWSMANARWRQVRTLLYLIYVEWLELLGHKARSLYAIEYLGHQRVITIDEVLNYEANLKNNNIIESDFEDI